MRPAKRPCGELGLCSNKGVFLLNSKPRLLGKAIVENLLGVDSEVGVSRFKLLACGVLPFVGLTHHNNVLALSERIFVVGCGLHDDLGIISGSLVAGGAIVVPFGDIGDGVDLSFKSSALGTESDARAVNPDVLSDSYAVDFLPAARVVNVLVVE